tara:strand:- start:257 stop:628 length:372 start_codon:yes stop_codon:yes gene_type:complete
MVLYYCEYCKFSTKYKTNYTRHLETKKHLKQVEIQTKNKQEPPQNIQMITQKKQIVKEDKAKNNLNDKILKKMMYLEKRVNELETENRKILGEKNLLEILLIQFIKGKDSENKQNIDNEEDSD